jgi:hypothetical protein
MFDGPARAIRCAERICAGADELDLRIRAGLHTGECELIDDDVAGIAVHIAARVSAQAGPGEVLVSRPVHDLVTGSGIALRSRGEHELKGVQGSWELFAVGSETAPLPAPTKRASCALATASCCSQPGARQAYCAPPAESAHDATAVRPRSEREWLWHGLEPAEGADRWRGGHRRDDRPSGGPAAACAPGRAARGR